MIESISYEKRTLGELFASPIKGQSESYFCLPRFQRKYEWEKEREVLRLIEDVFENLGNTYFMGPLIFCTKPRDLSVEIIDGQQRLVTFAIFYRALIDYIQTRISEGAFEGELIQNVQNLQFSLKTVIIKGLIKNPQAVIRLPSVSDKFFRDSVMLSESTQKINELPMAIRGEPPPIKRLARAYIKMFESLAEQYGSIKGERLYGKLRDLCDSLYHRQMFLSIIVQDYSDAFTIFETMNERGKRLTLSDLVKNLCFRKMYGLGEQYLDEFENDWNKTESLVSNFGSFIWHVWVSRVKTCPKSQTFREIEDTIEDMNPNDVFDFAYDLIFNEAEWYHTYEDPRAESEPNEILRERKRYFEMLKIMGATRCYPLLLAIDYAEKKTKSITPKQSNELVKTITCLTFWHSGVCEKDAKELESTYHDLARYLQKAEIKQGKQSAEEVTSRLKTKFPSVSECEASFTTKSFTDDSFSKMILRNVELSKYPAELTLKSDRVVWLEHILPRNPSSEWFEIFPKDKERERIEYTYRLGNYTLLLNKLDEQARNYPFSKKRELYVKSQIKLTQDLTKLEKWDASAIDQRTKLLFDLAKKIWPIY